MCQRLKPAGVAVLVAACKVDKLVSSSGVSLQSTHSAEAQMCMSMPNMMNVPLKGSMNN